MLLTQRVICRHIYVFIVFVRPSASSCGTPSSTVTPGGATPGLSRRSRSPTSSPRPHSHPAPSKRQRGCDAAVKTPRNGVAEKAEIEGNSSSNEKARRRLAAFLHRVSDGAKNVDGGAADTGAGAGVGNSSRWPSSPTPPKSPGCGHRGDKRTTVVTRCCSAAFGFIQRNKHFVCCAVRSFLLWTKLFVFCCFPYLAPRVWGVSVGNCVVCVCYSTVVGLGPNLAASLYLVLLLYFI